MIRIYNHRARAFTLIELMVSIFLLLLVMVGVNTVFTSASGTIGTGQAQSAVIRDSRAAYAVLSRDFASSTIVNSSDSPFIIISSLQRNAYLNAADMAADPTNNPLAGTPGQDTEDPDGDGTETTVFPALYGTRSHRLDQVQFFARGSFPRQTGGQTTWPENDDRQPFLSPTSSNEAWIWYGHLRLPRNTAPPNWWWADEPSNSVRTDPGLYTPAGNQNNFYASQWIVGRVAIGLAEKTVDNNTGTIGTPNQIFIDRNWTAGSGFGGTPSFGPFNYGSGSNPTGRSVEECRFDLAAVTISSARVRLAGLLQPMPTGQGPTFNWWTNIAGATPGQRFQAAPFVIRPLTAETVSQQFPVFLRGCTQFMVEFAGDFTVQNWDPNGNGTQDEAADIASANYGALVGAGQDGRIDTIVTGTGSQRRQVIRWYGLPRNVDTGDDPVGGALISSTAASARDVVPVRDIVGQQAFEKVVPTVKANYAAAGNAGMNKGEEYRCAWGPNDAARPKMIRITVNLVDPDGRLPNGQDFEYVFTCN